MNAPLEVAKAVTSLVVASGVGAVVGNAIRASTPENTKTIRKVAIGIGGFALANYAGTHVAAHTERQFDKTAEQFATLKDIFQKKN